MLVRQRKLGIPIHKYYFEAPQQLHWSDYLLPTAYFDSNSASHPYSFATEARHSLVTDLRPAETLIFQQFSKTNRNQLRRCEQQQPFNVQMDVPLAAFSLLYNRFAQHKELSLFTQSDADEIGRQHFHITGVLYQHKLLVTHLYLLNGETVSLLISASEPDYVADPAMRKLIGQANRCLHWQSMCYFKQQGFTRYDWGGYALHTQDSRLQGINRFKQSFNGELVTRYNHYSVAYALLEKLRQRLKTCRHRH